MVATWTGQLGRPYAEMWGLTPYEFSLVLKGDAKRRQQGMIDQAQIAYVSECLARMKKLPEIKTVIKWVASDYDDGDGQRKSEQGNEIADKLFAQLYEYNLSQKALKENG